MLDALGRAISRHPWVVVSLWLASVIASVAAAFGGVFGEPLFDRLSSGAGVVPGQTQDGMDLVASVPNRPGPSVMLLLDHVSAAAPALRTAIAATRRDLSGRDDVLSIRDPFADNDNLYDAESLPLVSRDQRAVLMIVTLRPGLGPATPSALGEIAHRLDQVPSQIPGSNGYVGGVNQITDEVTGQVEKDLRDGEGIALPVSLLITILVFGGFLAAMLPILGALAAIAGAMATLLAFSYVIDLDASTVNVVTVLGLGLCIDYGLLLVSRFREELTRLPSDPAHPRTTAQREQALRATMTTAGRTVLFSGITVAISLAGLMVFQASILRAIGAAGISVVVVALSVALTLVPALLILLKVGTSRSGIGRRSANRRSHRLRDVSPEEGAFSRLARFVQRFPLIVVWIVLSALFVASLPVLRMELVASGSALLPKGNEQRQLFDTLAASFPYITAPAVEVVADAPAEQVRPLVRELAALPAVVSVDDPHYLGTAGSKQVTVIGVRIAGSEGSPIARQVVQDIRGLNPGYQTWTTGNTSALIDYVGDLKTRAPFAVAIIVLTTFVLLFLLTGSVLVPVKALLMNVVSLGASLGVLVWIFQDGYLENALKFTSAGGLETFIPALAFAFGFGLAMDYEVFLLSRIVEYRRRGYPNDEAVVRGLQRSGRIITSAALIIVVVFAGFAVGKLLVIKETGIALAVAVAVDATLVRMLLVPATMTLLGEWNWWAPPFLRRLHDRVGLNERT